MTSPDAAMASPDAAIGAPDAGAGGPIQAVLDQRCNYFERAGLLVVSDPGGDGMRYASLALYDRPLPWQGPPELTTTDCVFFRASPGCACATMGEVCNTQGQCVPDAIFAPTVRVVASAPGGMRALMGDGQSLNGPIDLADSALALRIEALGWVVEVPPMALPAALSRPAGVLTGDESMPGRVDLSWDPSNSGASVYTHININHHRSDGTFTECVAPASQGMMHIEANMLTPLAVSTGLEFQGLEHIRFAKAETPNGCFEIRFSRQEFVSLSR